MARPTGLGLRPQIRKVPKPGPSPVPKGTSYWRKSRPLTSYFMHGIVVYAREIPLLEQKMRQSCPSVHWQRQIPGWGKPMDGTANVPTSASERRKTACMYVPVRKYKNGFGHTNREEKTKQHLGLRNDEKITRPVQPPPKRRQHLPPSSGRSGQ
jgi:hypothetical protein